MSNNHTFPKGRINDLIEDDYGFIWIGTSEGLFRFDGHKFLETKIPLDSNSVVPKEYFIKFEKDKQGRIWAGTFSDGLYLIDLKQNKAQHFLNDKNDENTISDNRIKDILVDEMGRIWIGCHKEGFCLYNSETNDFQRFKPSEILNLKDKARFVDDILSFTYHQEKLWFGTLNGFMSFDPNTGILDYSIANQILENPNDLIDNFSAVRNMTWIDENCFVFQSYISDNALFIYDDTKKAVNALRLTGKEAPIYGGGSSLFKAGNFIYFLVEKQIAKIDINTWRINWLDNSYKTTNYPYIIRHFFEDSQLNRWAWSPRKLYILEHLPDNAQIFGLSNKAESIFKLENETYLFWEENKSKGGKINLATKELKKYEYPLIPNIVTGSEIKNCYRSTEQNIYSDNSRDIVKWNNLSQKFEYLINPNESFPTVDLGDFIAGFFDSQNQYWLGTKNDGIVIVNLSNKLVKWMKNDSSTSNKIVYNGYPNGFFEDDLGNIWYGTHRGFGYYNSQKKDFVNFPFEAYKTDHPTLTMKSIKLIKKDKQNRIWLAGEREGLGYFELTKNAPQIKMITDENGLWDYHIRDLEIDEFGNIWVSHWHGISKISGNNLSVENFGKESGIPPFAALHFLDNNELAILKSGKMLLLDSENLKQKEVFPKAIINDFKVFDESLNLGKNWMDIETVDLDYAQNFFSIDFGVINFSNPDLTEIQYKLKGVQKDWTNANNRTYASFVNVGGGDYEFQIRARIKNVDWGTPRILKIKIAYPFWQTWWFYLLIISILAALICSLYLMKIRQVREKEKLKSQFQVQLAEVEMTALRAQMNPHFLFNCLNSIKLFIVENDTEAASDYLTKFSKLIRLILQNSKNKLVLLSDELESLKLYIEMEKMRFDNQFEYEIRVAENVPSNHLEIPPLILQPYVENAIWHGLVHEVQPNKLIIEVKKEVDKLICIIEDNGIGREAARTLKLHHRSHKKSMGMTITQNRIDLTKKLYEIDTKVEILDLKNEEEEGIGTRVVLSIPLVYFEKGKK